MKQKILSIIMVIVVAFNTISIPASAETLTLSKPESISLVQKTESTIKIEWSAVKNADKYQVCCVEYNRFFCYHCYKQQ